MMITILCAVLGLGGFLYASFSFYWLRAEARRAGYPVSVFTNTEDPWPQLNKMISAAPPDRRIRLEALKRNMILAMIVAILGFIGSGIAAASK